MKLEELDPKTRKALRKVWSNIPRTKKPRTRSKEQRRRDSLWNKYGMRETDYAHRVLGQDGLCAICGERPAGKRPALCVDHCHNSKAVRGLLCSACNSGLGYFKDSPARLASAISYLSK